MTKFDIKRSKTTIIIMAALLIGFLMFSSMTILPNVKAQIHSQLLKNDYCTSAMSAQMHSKAATLNNEKAILLTSNNNEFKSKTKEYNVTFALIFNRWHLDQSNCNVEWSDVNVGYYLTDKAGHYVENLVVTMDPTLTKISKVDTYVTPRFGGDPSQTWSGYELGHSGDNVTEAYTSYNIPQIWQSTDSINKCVPTTGQYASPGCDLSVWVGLEDESLAFPDNRLVQAGSDGNLTCNNSSCTSPTYLYYIWIQFLDPTGPPFVCYKSSSNSTISYGDSISADVGLVNSTGNTGYYNITVQDLTANESCSVTNHAYTGLTAPTRAAFINERASWNPKGYDELANFSSDNMSGEIAFNWGSLNTINSSEILTPVNMTNLQ